MALVLSASSSSQPLKVLTYNTMLVCVGPWCVLAEETDLKTRAEGIGQWLNAEKPDIVFLQEVYKKTHFDLIAAKAAMPHRWFVGSGSGMAILSRYPLSHTAFTPYRWQGAYVRECKRLFAGLSLGVGIAELSLGDGQKIMLATTHLLPRYSEVEGFAQPSDAHTPERKVNLLELGEEISKQTATRGRPPMILAGDLNMNQASEEYAFFRRNFNLEDVLRQGVDEKIWKGLCTYCAVNPHVKRQNNPEERILDYIMVSPKSFRVKEAKIVTDQDFLSDHRAVIAVLETTDQRNPFIAIQWPSLEIPVLQDHITKVEVSPYCWFAPPSGWNQRRRTLEFLKR